MDFERRDGRYRYRGHSGRHDAEGLDGLVREIDARTKVRLHDRGDVLQQKYGIRVGGHGAPEPAREHTFSESGVGWCWGPGVFWAQARTRESYEVPAPAWIYAGMVQSFMTGYEFAFYCPADGRLRLIVEAT